MSLARIATIAALLAIAGCGSDSAPEQRGDRVAVPKDAYLALQQALVDDDAEGFCHLMTAPVQRDFGREYGDGNCETAFRRYRTGMGPEGVEAVGKIRVRDQRIDGSTAVVTVCCEPSQDGGVSSRPSRERFALTETGWKLAQ